MVAVYAVALDKLSNTTSSSEVGMTAPEAPPELVDHLVVLLQLPVPPTQYRVRPAGAAVNVKFVPPVLFAPAKNSPGLVVDKTVVPKAR